MFKRKTKRIVKKTLRIFVTVITAVIMTGVGNLLPAIPTVSAAVTTRTVTGLTTWNQVVAPSETLAVYGLNLVGDSGESFNSLTLQIMGPTDSLVALSGTARPTVGLRLYKTTHLKAPTALMTVMIQSWHLKARLRRGVQPLMKQLLILLMT